jgi:phosphatidylserine decarboxylase
VFARGSWTWTYALPPAVVGAALLAISSLWGVLGLGLAAFVLWFHRDPEREIPDSGVVSPADGKVSVIREETIEGEDEQTDDTAERLRVGVFMNVHDVHVNRAPMPGAVEAVDHRDGGHRPAFDKDSEHNERVRVDFEKYAVVLIAGAFARRIHPYVEAGVSLERGERLGHISFGSRADVLLPPEYDRDDLAVEQGDRVRAGESVLARQVE